MLSLAWLAGSLLTNRKMDTTESDDNAAKRQRQPQENSQIQPPPAPPPAAWPSASQLYARGLENRAEAVGTSDQSWSINGSEWRSSTGFERADADGAVLKQRQAEARRAMLRRPS